eukprot:2800364-Rhodomonas_salina.2
MEARADLGRRSGALLIALTLLGQAPGTKISSLSTGQHSKRLGRKRIVRRTIARSLYGRGLRPYETEAAQRKLHLRLVP